MYIHKPELTFPKWADKKHPMKPAATQQNSKPDMAQMMYELQWRLLFHRKWGYLRYIHLRNAFTKLEAIGSVLSVGCGMGFAEVLLAIEHPEIQFHLTDVITNYDVVKGFVEKWSLHNVTFGFQNILEPVPNRYDLVMSVEVMEHIENDVLAAAQMRAASNRYVFALIPFADKRIQHDEIEKKKALQHHGHMRVGYTLEDLNALFPNITAAGGCYWIDAGFEYQKYLATISETQIRTDTSYLHQMALMDIRPNVIPSVYPDAQGIWMVSRVDPRW